MNDTYVMLFFGLLKKLVEKWMNMDSDKVVWLETLFKFTMSHFIIPLQAQSLQNDLLCGQGVRTIMYIQLCNYRCNQKNVLSMM